MKQPAHLHAGKWYYCQSEQVFPTSYASSGSGNWFYEVNRRTVYALRNIGEGRSALVNFCMIMDMPPPVLRNSYSTHVSEVCKASVAVCDEFCHSNLILFNSICSSTISMSWPSTWLHFQYQWSCSKNSRNWTYSHCLAHSTNLCLQTVGRNMAFIWEALDLTMEFAQFIRFSPKRSSLFKSLQAQLSPGALSLKSLCPTCWTVHTKAHHGTIGSNYGVLTKALVEIHESGRDEYALTAGGYLLTMDKFSTYM